LFAEKSIMTPTTTTGTTTTMPRNKKPQPQPNGRDAYSGLDRPRLRGTLQLNLGTMRGNQDIFEVKGNPWTHTPTDDYEERKLVAELNQHRFEAFNGKLSDRDKERKRQEPQLRDFLSKDKPVHKPFDRPLTIREARQLDGWIEQRLGYDREEQAIKRQPRPFVDGKELSRQNKDIKAAQSRKSRKNLADFKRKHATTKIIKNILLLDAAHTNHNKETDDARDLGHFKVINPKAE